MVDISTYAWTVLIGVALFGAVLGVLRILHERRLKSAAGAIEKLQGRAAKELQSGDRELKEDEDLIERPALYGIPYLALILTALMILVTFLLLFFENLAPSYRTPELGSVAWHAYRAPVSFEAEGRSFLRHDVLVAKGQRITYRDQRVIQAALASKGRVSGLRVLGTMLLVTVFFFVLLYHINILYPSVTEKNKNLILIYLAVTVVLCCAKLSLFYDLFSPYLIPVPWAGIVITILVNRRIVPLTVLITLLLVLIDSRIEFSLFIVLLAGGLVSGSWVRRARKRSELMMASLFVGAIMALVHVCSEMVTTQEFHILSQEVAASLGNGVVSGLMALIFLPLLEIVFDFASPFRLMELLDLNTPLMKEFFFKAPGTYQHSMVVANIAESVANEIGASGLLVRVGAYYHDIGKIFNPQYFIENQAGGPNPHDDLGPVASAAVVRSHVILGVKLARRIKLPGAVIDFIPEHHGTSTIDYFYFKSKNLDSEIKSEKIFKYPGPRPQSRETAIVMIVDSVEAAFRLVEDRSEENIRHLVNKIANRKLEQGELDRSNLTIGELKKIVNTLTHIMKSSSHQRIAYPSFVAENGETTEKKSSKSGDRRPKIEA